jgi:hypothetical protein
MSRLFGAAVQQGYVVPDIDAAMQHWIARGVGPFFIEHLRGIDAVVEDKAVKLELKAAFAYSGDQQIEVIQPLGSEPCVYTEYLRDNPRGGLQHLAFWCDSIPDTLDALQRSGRTFRVHQRYADAHAYLDCVDAPGVMIQLMARTPQMEGLFRIIKDGAEHWNGVTDPVRRIDWSTGVPVIHAA